MTSNESRPPATPAPSEETRQWIILFRRGFTRLFENVSLILKCLYAACAFFVALELFFFFGLADKEAHYRWENVIGFYAAYGFVSCVLLVMVSKYLLRPVVIRPEDYYDHPSKHRD
ncbi:MAG: hypothetical protein R3F07_01165 [Opitutaceae bacterium]